jgi:hypothetical protein
MGNFKTMTSGFLVNRNYRVRVTAENGVGLGIWSDPVYFLSDDYPVRMNTPTEDPTTNANLIKVNWEGISDPIDTGRDDVIYYQLDWDQGTGVWANVTEISSMVYTWTFSDSIKNGTVYNFRVTPKNRAGFGAVSSVLSVIPSSPPDKMSVVAVTMTTSSTAVKIAWTAP